MAAGGRVQELGWSWGFLITVFTLEFNLFYLKVNLSTCSHEDCQPSVFSKDLKTQTPKNILFANMHCVLVLADFTNTS